MNEESAPSEPPPPDIRPFGRFHSASRNHDRAVNESSIITTRFRHHGVTPWLLLVALAVAVVPVASASLQPPTGADPYTSYVPITNTKPTPLLNLLGYFVTFLLDALSELTGVHHVSTEGMRGLAKRLDQTGKIEAGMIPVLVALSGTFAGLTLG